MNPKLLLISLAGILLFGSCSKEASFERKRDVPDETGPLLVKTILQSSAAAYTTTTVYKYDGKNKLVNIKTDYEGTITEPYAEQESAFIRNSKGAIKTISDIWNIFDENDNLVARDSIAFNLNFTPDGKYSFGVRTFFNTDNKKIRDSIVYGYNNKERISQVMIFRKMGDSQVYEDFQKTDYTYDETDHITTTTIRFYENVQDPAQTFYFTYNDKTSPMNFKDEALLSGFLMEGLNSPHCLTSIKDITEPENNWNVSYDGYNQAEKPIKAIYTNSSTQEKISIAYFYQ